MMRYDRSWRRPRAGALALLGLLVMSAPLHAQQRMEPMAPMAPVTDATVPTIPAVNGYSAGEPILFLHTATSDAKIADILTEMMGGSPVLVVPSLAEVPRHLRAAVYVFTNGMTGNGPMGPLGGQADVFGHPPGEAGYTPLREVILVTWQPQATPRLLTSAAAVAAARDAGEVRLESSGVVVNMPFLTWPGGRR